MSTTDVISQPTPTVNFSRIFRLLAQRFRNREALVITESGLRYSFHQLHLLSNRIANMITDVLGLGAGERYLLILRNENLSLMHFWTILKAPAVAVFTNANDSYEEHIRQIDFVKPKCVFLDSERVSEFYDALKERGIKLITMGETAVKREGMQDFWQLVDNASQADPDYDRPVTDTVFCRFTGGTTGTPKCATYSYRNVEHAWYSAISLEDNIFNLNTRCLHITPISHGSILFMIPTFFSGGGVLSRRTTLIYYVGAKTSRSMRSIHRLWYRHYSTAC